MSEEIKRENENFQQEYAKFYSKGTWKPEDLEIMKNLKKLIYYNLAICAMEEGEGHPGAGHLPEMSGARGRDSMGRFTSGNGDWSRSYDNYQGGSGGMHPRYPMDGGMYYDNGMTRSGQRYYDSEREKAIKKLHQMMNDTDDPDRKNAYKIALNELESPQM